MTNSIKKYRIGQGLPELTPVETVGYEVDETGSPLALARPAKGMIFNGWKSRLGRC